jgi:hypothetical protein
VEVHPLENGQPINAALASVCRQVSFHRQDRSDLTFRLRLAQWLAVAGGKSPLNEPEIHARVSRQNDRPRNLTNICLDHELFHKTEKAFNSITPEPSCGFMA